MNLNEEVTFIVDGDYIKGKIIKMLDNKYLVLLNDGSQIYVNKEDVI